MHFCPTFVVRLQHQNRRKRKNIALNIGYDVCKWTSFLLGPIMSAHSFRWGPKARKEESILYENSVANFLQDLVLDGPLQFFFQISWQSAFIIVYIFNFFFLKKKTNPILMHISGLRICLPGQSCSAALLLLLHGWSKGILPWGDRSPHQLVSSSS